MCKALEALERLKTAPSFMGGTEKYMFSTQSEIALLEDYEIVKQALIKAQEQEKVLEIIKKKDVDMYSLRRCVAVEEYNIDFAIDEYQKLTQEEFDLLKEVLKDER